ncbi:cation-translocating P-type ATPase [Methanobrevibacter woesei]|uniref:heavy metal translocating P-type ATPase n=1 Tax=Methanobrevibacter woesei TaxID=190976 RepID=UPI0023F52CF8|nr:cation-translocating P-type ATPase [Methanobrevibacter woesei]
MQISEKESHHHHHDNHHHHDDTCNHDHHEHGPGCACEADLLENIDEDVEQSKKPLAIFAIGIAVLAIGHVIELLSLAPMIVSQLIFLVGAVYVGHDIMKHGIIELTHKKVKIELLITIATLGAFLLGSGGEGALLMVLFYLGEYLEHYSLNKSKSSLVKLVKMTPDTALVKHDDHEHEKTVKDVKIGDIVIVKPGDKIPVDGIISKGITSVNQASITGESLAVSKTVGDEVYASTINEEGYIEIEVNKNPDDTIFAKIIDLIKNSEENKAKIDVFIDRFAEIYTPIVVVLALLVAVLPPFFIGGSIADWTYRALTLLVIACPCALVISTPVSIVSAITKGTKNGIIIKGGEYVEELSRIKEILFDKTGTLTEGKLEIAEVKTLKEDVDIMQIACSIESKSKHPIANSFNRYQKDNNLSLLDVDNFESIAGKGLKGEINNITYFVGKETLFPNQKIEIDNKKMNTTVIIGTEEEVLGIITLKDRIRTESKSTIAKINSLGIKTTMITGDNEETAKSVADELGLTNYHANLLPEDKVNIVNQSVEQYKDVAMVGDGVNDTPSLARANVGIAMGLDGADVAIETGDIVLLEDKLSKLTLLLDLAKRTMGKIKFNVAFCLTIKVILMILGVAGYINLWEATLIGDMGITLIVVGNSLLLAK